MPFWSGEKLGEEVRNCITGPYDTDNIDCASYTLHVGPEIFVTPDHYEPNPSQNTKRKLAIDEAFNIPSGQFAFLLTEEEVSVSDKCIAFISMKASTKFKGLVNVSGFHVDPGYKGRLVFSVFNAGPMPIKLKRGMPLFLMWLADLDRQTTKIKSGKSTTELDLKILDPIHGPIFSPQSISNSVKDFKDEIIDKLSSENQAIRKELSEHKESISQRLTIVNRFIGGGAVVVTILVYLLRGSLLGGVGAPEEKVTSGSSMAEDRPVEVRPVEVKPVEKPEARKAKNGGA